jgi:anti-anti-sigma regulatory factor
MMAVESGTQRGNKELALLIGAQRESLVRRLVEDWMAYLNASAQEVTPLVNATLDQLVDAVATGAAGRLVDPLAEWASEQAARGIGVGTLWRLTHSLSMRLWDVVAEARIAPYADAKATEPVGWLRDLVDLIALAQAISVDALVTARDTVQSQALGREQERTTRLAEAGARLAERVRELSSPVIKVWEEVLVLPLVGAIDAERAARMMEDLLQGIIVHQAEIVIIDVTGVPVVDTTVVNHLMQTVKAASLLGAHSVLVGISAEVALAMVQLGVDLTEIETRSNLQAGIEFALQELHLQIVSRDQVCVEGEVSDSDFRSAANSDFAD